MQKIGGASTGASPGADTEGNMEFRRAKLQRLALPGALLLAALLLPAELLARCPELRWNPAERELSLAGQWRIQAQPGPQELAPDLARDLTDDSGWRLAPVPSDFAALKLRPPAQGLSVFYRCRIILEGPPPSGLALYLGRIGAADAVFFNGEPIGESGQLRRQIKVDIEKPRLYPLPAALWKEGANVIAVRVFATTGLGGLRHEPRIVSHLAYGRLLIKEDLPAIVFSWSYVLVAAFFALFYIFFWRQWEHLFFALFSLSLGLYHLIRTRLRYEWFDNFALSYATELVLLFTLPFFFLEYLHHTTRAKRGLPVKVVYGAYALLIPATVVFGNTPRVWTLLININLALIVIVLGITAWVFSRNYTAHRDKLRYILIGFVAITPVILWDVLSTLGLHSYPRLLVFGFAAFLLFASLQLSDTILRLYGNIREQEQELRQLEKRKAKSIFNISSEFGSILSGLRDGIVAPGENGGSRRGARGRDTERLRSSAVKLDNLVNDSRLLNLLESGDYTPRSTRFSLHRLLEETVARALLAAEQPRSRIQFNPPGDEIEAEGDAELLAAALYHLVENALLYSQGKVEIAAERVGGELIFEVRDEGPGMNEEQRHSVFQKFVRARDDNEGGPPGSGVGLTIVREIAEVLGGEVRLEGGGYFSTFTLRTPERQAA